MNIFRKGYFYSVLSIKLIDHLICLLTMYQSTIDGLKEYAIMLNGFPNLTYACIKRLSLKFTKNIYHIRISAPCCCCSKSKWAWFQQLYASKKISSSNVQKWNYHMPVFRIIGLLIILNVFLITAFVTIKNCTKRSNNFKIYEKYSMG